MTQSQDPSSRRERVASGVARVEQAFGGLVPSIGDRIPSRRRAAGQTIVLGLASVGAFSQSVAAQSTGGADSVMCTSGLGQLIGIVFTVASAILLVLAALKGMQALNKSASTSSQSTREGRQKGKDAATTFAAVFVPGVLAALLEVMDISTVSCLAPSDWSVVGAIVFLPF